MLHSESMLKHPHSQLGPREWTNMLPSEVPMIDAATATAMRKVYIHQFMEATRKWNWWCYDFEVAMMGADIL